MDLKESLRQLGSVAWTALYWLLMLGIALCVFVYFLRTSGMGVNGKATFERALTGTAYRPYAYRVLLPATANLLSRLIDRTAALQLGIQSETVLGDKFFRARLNGRIYPGQVVLLLIMMYLSLVGFAVVMWCFVRDLGYGARTRYLAPPVLLLASAIFFGFGYMYDFTVLFLFSLGLWLMWREQWGGYLLAFALGTLNKETTAFLLLVFAVYFLNRMPRRKFIALAALQLGVYVVIQGIIRFVFRNNPGGIVEWHYAEQLATFREIAANAPWLLALWAAALAVIALAMIYKWKQKPAFLHAALVILPFLLVLSVFWGFPLEIRNMYEVFPTVAILILPPPASGRNTHVPATASAH
jgi:hypothetical protein